MNLKELKELFRLVEKSDFAEVSLKKDDWSVDIVRNKPFEMPAIPNFNNGYNLAQHSNTVSDGQNSTSKTETVQGTKTESGEYILSPFVGTFYSAPSPDADSFVSEGQSIKKGDVVCIVEAMKLMNELESEVSGKIKKVLVDNGQPVEFGEKLFLIES